MAIDSQDATTLEPGILLKCSKCGEWHTVHDGRRPGQSPQRDDMLYWTCRGRVFFAGHTGAASTRPLRRRHTA